MSKISNFPIRRKRAIKRQTRRALRVNESNVMFIRNG